MRPPRLAPLLVAAGCFSPTVEDGAACSIEGECPPGQTCAADGRCYAGAPVIHFRRRIDLHPLSFSNVQRDFTLSVALAGDPGLAANARDDGLDLHFTEADGTTELAFEVESFDAEAGDLVAWVRVPLLSLEDTIYLHYGGEPFDRPAPASAWHERYLAVWHGAGDQALLVDSTGNHNDGASAAALEVPERVAGVVGTALSFDGVDDQVAIDEAVPLLALAPEADLVLTMWVRVDDGGRLEVSTALGKGNQAGSDPGFGVQTSSLQWLVRLRGGGSSDTMPADFGEPSELIGRWVMLGVEITDASEGEEYFDVVTSVDGEGVGNGYWQCVASPCEYDLGGALFLSHPEARFKGMIDEIRIVDRALGSESQRAEFENLSDPETFYTVGPEETLGF